MAQPAVIGMSDNYPGFDIDQAQFERFSRDATHGRTEDAKAMAGVSRDETAFELSTKKLAWEKCDKNRALFDQVRYALGVLRAAHSTVLFPSVDRDDEILQELQRMWDGHTPAARRIALESYEGCVGVDGFATGVQ